MEEKREGFIYKIVSPTGGIYIGQTFNLNRRMLVYKYLGCRSQKMLYNSLLKYGYGEHIIEVVNTGIYTIKELLELEIFYIKYFDSFNNGMNLTTGGEGGNIIHHSEETKKKISESKKNKPKTERQILANLKSFGVKHTEERNKKKSESQGGVNHWAYGLSMSEETIQKKSESMKNRYNNGYISPRLGVIVDDQVKEKIKISKSIPVTQYSKSGEFIKNWTSAKEASMELKINNGNICCCCNGKRETSGGFIWKHKITNNNE